MPCKSCRWAASCPCLERAVIRCLLCPDMSLCRCSAYWENVSFDDLAVASHADLLAPEDLEDDVL